MNVKRFKIIGISIASIAILALIILFMPQLFSAVKYIIKLFLPFILGYLFAVAVMPIVKLLQKRFKLSRQVTAIIIMLLILGVIGGIVTYIISKIVGEARSIYNNFPAIYVNVLSSWNNINDKFSNIYSIMPDGIKSSLDNLEASLLQSITKFFDMKHTPIFQSAGNVAKSLPNIFISSIVFLLASFFTICDIEKTNQKLLSLFKPKAKQKLSLLKHEIKNYIGGYIKAQGIIMLFVFVILYIGFKILGVEYALLIALATAFLDALPFFGTGAVLWPWCIISFLFSNIKFGIGTIIIYLCVILTRQLLEPKIISNNIGTNPLLTLMSMYIGYKTFSVGGMILGPLLLMFLISLYRSGMLDGLFSLVKTVRNSIVAEFQKIKQHYKE